MTNPLKVRFNRNGKGSYNVFVQGIAANREPIITSLQDVPGADIPWIVEAFGRAETHAKAMEVVNSYVTDPIAFATVRREYRPKEMP